jgi:pimeloyl-ACP methyl ester carboxylesterase
MTDVVLVHGAFHGPRCWAKVQTELTARGLTSYAVELPLEGLAADARVARVAVEDAIEDAGPCIVVVGHSYGGVVISEAASGVTGVGGLVYVAAFMLDAGEDQLAILSEHGSELLGSLVAVDGGIAVDPARARDVFYGDSTPEDAARIIADLRPMREAAAESAGGPGREWGREPAWKAIPATYVACTHDRALPVAAQRSMATRAERVVELPTDHSPFLTRAAELAALIAERFDAAGTAPAR